MSTDQPEPDWAWGRARAGELLHRTASWLAAERRGGRYHTMIASNVGGLARESGFATVERVARTVLTEAPDAAFSAGVITNMDPAAFIERELPDAARVDAHCPRYEGSIVDDYVRRMTEPHIAGVLAGALDDAARAIVEPLDAEEYAATCAVAGHLDEAERFIDRDAYPDDRRIIPRMVLCVEAFLRGDTPRAAAALARVCDDDDDPWCWIQLAAGLLGRVPWGGYPYPDY